MHAMNRVLSCWQAGELHLVSVQVGMPVAQPELTLGFCQHGKVGLSWPPV